MYFCEIPNYITTPTYHKLCVNGKHVAMKSSYCIDISKLKISTIDVVESTGLVHTKADEIYFRYKKLVNVSLGLIVIILY